MTVLSKICVLFCSCYLGNSSCFWALEEESLFCPCNILWIPLMLKNDRIWACFPIDESSGKDFGSLLGARGACSCEAGRPAKGGSVWEAGLVHAVANWAIFSRRKILLHPEKEAAAGQGSAFCRDSGDCSGWLWSITKFHPDKRE